MEEVEKDVNLKLMKYGNGSSGNGQYCKSQELVLVSGLQEEVSTSRSTDLRMKNEGKVVYRKKSLLPIFAPNHPYRSACYTVSSNCKSNVSMFTQRIMSAKLLGVRNLQNKLTETEIRLQELVEENRVLNALLKRQERALKKYEGEEAQLPQLIKTHSDEMRVLQTKYKQMKATCHDLEQKLKARDNDLNCLREQHKHLLHLSKDKHLGEREKLREQVEGLLDTVNAQEEKIKTLMRKVELESKNYKHQLRVEIGKHRETQRQLSLALSSVQKLEAALEVKHKYSAGITNRPHHFTSNGVMGPLPAISKQSNNQTALLKKKLDENSCLEHSSPGKNGSDSNPTTVTSSAPNSEYEGSEASGSHAKNSKTSQSSSDSQKSKRKEVLRSKSKSRSSSNYDYNFESSESINANYDPDLGKNNALPSIFINESLDKKQPTQIPSESSRKSLTRQGSVHNEDEPDLKVTSCQNFASKKPEIEHAQTHFKDKEGHLRSKILDDKEGLFSEKISTSQKVYCPKSSSDGEMYSRNSGDTEVQSYGNIHLRNFKEYCNGDGSDKDEQSWEEIKQQIRAEHAAAKKKLKSFTNVDSDLLDFSLGNELDTNKKDALLRALNDIDRERNCEHSDSDGSYKEKFHGDFLEFYGSSRSPSDKVRLNSDEGMMKTNGLVRDWFVTQYDYGAPKLPNERGKQVVSTGNRKGSDSSS